MARKPKADSSNDFAVSPEEVLAVLSDAPAPVRGGRKPKVAASPEPLATMDSDDAVGGFVDADGSIADPIAAPVRKRGVVQNRVTRGAWQSRVDASRTDDGTLTFSGAVRNGSMCWRSGAAARG